ncbi:hypothetical protein GBA65_03640 [Rubrobacter marinus]|uniref:Uncharacterized protein n=1 Tax=Rubrobacter marinus TaxID=2653852 RepID=A0A6G8PTD9_9ACTN|nr:hypothetical protein [Rubrobacter marinus]QIN77759.1 hypothetical protein GBA65_03640 [Rubrobacter marinus]
MLLSFSSIAGFLTVGLVLVAAGPSSPRSSASSTSAARRGRASRRAKEQTRPQPRQQPRGAAPDYGGKVSHETEATARRAARPDLPYPSGDPLSGVALVAHPAPSTAGSARLADALRRSLAAVGLDAAYLTWSPSGPLREELLSLEPAVLVAVGPGAARTIDEAGHALVKTPFLRATEGAYFPWTRGTTGLLLPDLAPALEDDEAKRRFWRAFLALRDLAPDGSARA